ncbi:hypothetical protein TWF730_009057 [Orbilia blumenaviensis]|uniref:F-box domain-containing protein n=1 Tax=Orbilia blumenaviensis TaxID=1796055 RepID=A0AAV9V0I4_9PEZI
MGLTSLPVEILIQIASSLRVSDLSSLLKCNRKLRIVCIPLLYRHVELRLYGQQRILMGKVFPLSLLKSESPEYFTGTRSLAIIGCDHYSGTDRDDDEDFLLMIDRERPVAVPLQHFVERIPNGNLWSFEFKVDFPIIADLFIGVLATQPNLVNLYISFENTTQGVRKERVFSVNLPSLKRLKLVEIYRQSDVWILNRILETATNLVEIDLSWDLDYPDVNRSTHQGTFTRILHHRPKILKVANIDMTPQLLEASGLAEELHLRDVTFPRDRNQLNLGYNNPHAVISLKNLLITTIPPMMGYFQKEILDRLLPGLEELHVTVNHLDRDGETEVRESIPIPLENVLRHAETLKYLSLFEKTSEGNFFIDSGPVCEAELKIFQHCGLEEFATTINFYCHERTPGYWKTFEMSPVDVNYAHYAQLHKLYIIPDMISLNDQIDSDQGDFSELNPRNIFSYQMASMVLTNIGFYTETKPNLRYLVVGTGNAYRGQKVFLISWDEHIPPYRKREKQRRTRYLFTLSPPYEIQDFREQGVKFRCFEGTKFTSGEDRKWATVW